LFICNYYPFNKIRHVLEKENNNLSSHLMYIFFSRERSPYMVPVRFEAQQQPIFESPMVAGPAQHQPTDGSHTPAPKFERSLLPFKQSQAIPPPPRSNPSYAGRSARHGRAARPHWVAPPQGERTRRQAPAYRRLRRAASPRPGLPAARRGAHRVHGQGGCRQPPQREDEGQEQDGLQGRFHFFSPISRLRLPSVDSISSAPVTHQ
jgi:hypothetical protein